MGKTLHSPSPADTDSDLDSLASCPIVSDSGHSSVETFGGSFDHDLTEMDESLDEMDKCVIINIKDSHDTKGAGMTFNLSYTSTFKNIFKAFKAASCKTCRPAEFMRFKVIAKRLYDHDGPFSLSMKHEETLSIRAYSNSPGLCCAACQKDGYPSTRTKRYNGDSPVFEFIKPTKTKVIRLLFRDPNGTFTGVTTSSVLKLKHAMGDYARNAKCDVRTLRFNYDNESVADDDTAEELGLKNNSVIEVYMDPMGA